MWSYNNTNELCHFGVPGMKWGVRRSERKQSIRTAKKLNKKLTKAFKALDNYNKTIQVKEIGNSATDSPSTLIISNDKKKQAYGKAVNDVNRYMNKLDEMGFKWEYDSNYGPSGKLVNSGKSYVETIVNGQKIRKEW